MNFAEISNIRLSNQKIETTTFAQAVEVVSWMGAMQAQDYNMAKWAIGQRMSEATDEKVESALNEGKIIRTHLMRPTWHFVSAGDIYWMLDLTAPRIKSAMKSRNKELELTDAVLNTCFGMLEIELSETLNLTREQITKLFHQAKIKTDENRLSHILMSAELEGLLCSGRKIGNKHTYALLSERVPDRKVMLKDESLAELARRYFNSHGPATLKDFTWWSGLTVAEARKALDFVKPEFISETLNPDEYWLSKATVSVEGEASAHLLPAFDEFLISYTDRSASLELAHNRKAVSNNGIFYPVIVINGQVSGTWKRTTQKDRVKIETHLFTAIHDNSLAQITKEIGAYSGFLNKKL